MGIVIRIGIGRGTGIGRGIRIGKSEAATSATLRVFFIRRREEEKFLIYGELECSIDRRLLILI